MISCSVFFTFQVIFCKFVGDDAHIGPREPANSPKIIVKNGLYSRVDVGIDPYA